MMALSKNEQHGSVDTSVILVVTLAACWDEPHVIPCLQDASHTNHTARDRCQHAHPGISLQLQCLLSRKRFLILSHLYFFGHTYAHKINGIRYLV